jgi:hypothetical protein
MSNKTNDNQWIFLLEKSSSNIELVNEGNNENKKTKDYILEGTFAELDKENDNNRIYEKQEYLNQLGQLQERAKKNALLGEMDHPEGFDISLQNASHKVENVWYNKKNNTIEGRIRLLPTIYGEQARNLVDAGVPLYISSRAAGQVGNDKKVKIKKIFTYDLVSVPGFSGAQLSQVQEGEELRQKYREYYKTLDNQLQRLAEKNNKNYSSLYSSFDYEPRLGVVNDADDLTIINEDFGLDSDYGNQIIYTLNESQVNRVQRMIDRINFESENFEDEEYESEEENLNYEINKTNEINKTKNKLKEMGYETEKTTNKLKQKVDRLAEAHNKNFRNVEKEIKNLRSKVPENSYQQRKIEQISNYLEEHSRKINEAFEDIENKIDSVAGYAENNTFENDNSIKELKNEINAYSKQIKNAFDTLENKFNKLVSYTEAIGQTTNQLIDYTQNELREGIHNNREYMDGELRPNVESAINYSENIAEHVNHIVDYTEELRENIQGNRDYSEFIAERTNDLIDYTQDEIKPYLEGSINYSDKLKENIEAIGSYMEDVIQPSVESSINYTETIAESLNESGITEHYQLGDSIEIESIDETVDNALEAANQTYSRHYSESVDELYPFVRMLSENQKQFFYGLSSAQKQIVSDEIAKNQVYHPNQIYEVCRRVYESDQNAPSYIKNMPKQYVNVWNNLSESERNQIHNQAKIWNFDSQNKINKFWKSNSIVNDTKSKSSQNFQGLSRNNGIYESAQEQSTNELGYEDGLKLLKENLKYRSR